VTTVLKHVQMKKCMNQHIKLTRVDYENVWETCLVIKRWW